MASVKEEAMRIAQELPEAATWDDLMYQVYVHHKVAQGDADVAAGRVVPQAKARRRTGKR